MKTLSFSTFTVLKYMYFEAWIYSTKLIIQIESNESACVYIYIICCMYCSTKNFYLIRQIIDPQMLYILGYMCQNENIDASAINTEKWKGTKLRAASQKSSKMVIKIPSTSNQMKVSSCFFSSELSNIMI